jgi:hypothetical protein
MWASFKWLSIPSAGHSLTEIEEAVDQVIRKFINEGPTDEELQRAKAWIGTWISARP